MDVEDIWRRRLTEQYDKLILRTLERYGYDLKTTLYLLSIGEMKIEEDGSGTTVFYGSGERVKLENQYPVENPERKIPLFSITETTYEVFDPGDKIRIYPYKKVNELRVKDLTNNNFETLCTNVMF